MSAIPSTPVVVLPPTLTIEGLMAGFAAAGVTDANASTILPLAVVVAEAVNAAGITPQQFATFATKAIASALAQAAAQKASLTKPQALLAQQLAALGV